MLEIAESERSALDQFHIAIQALGEAVRAREAPHTADLHLSGLKCAAELPAILNAAFIEFTDRIEERVNKNAALIFGLF